MRTYVIEETARYYVVAKHARDAERRFLAAIRLDPAAHIHTEVPERAVYQDEEDRLNTETRA